METDNPTENVPQEPISPESSPDSSSEIEVPKKLIDQVIGQEHAVEVIKKAAIQRRHVMMIGSPGTGKSMLAKAMSELLPKEEMQDILVYPNSDDSNNPVVRTVPAGRGKQIVTAHKAEARKKIQLRNTLMMLLMIGIIGYAFITYQWLMGIIAAAFIFMALRYATPREDSMVPKLLVSNDTTTVAPFVDATGSHAGALLGDVRHDPFQSGGLETPSHDRVEAGAIHRAHKGVLFIDEINTLTPHSQQNLLTALQEGEFPITGQSERSSGAMVRTEPVPCKFIMIAAGNLDAIQGMHPALRSRIRGYGYEVYMGESMPDTPENREKFVRFIAQEIQNDGKIPHFDRGALEEVIREGRRRSNRKGHLTLKLRDMGGLIRVAGDLARQAGSEMTTAEHVIAAKKTARSIEDQVSDEYITRSREYELTMIDGTRVGRVNGLAVMGSDSGSVLPIMAEVTPAQGASGTVVATGLLKEIAQESIKNVSAILKKFTGKDIRNMDIHIQFIGTYGGVEGDSASISVATAVISAIENIPVRQDIGMTGSLSVRGDVLPVGGVTYKIEAAAKAGIKTVLIPRANIDDVLIEERYQPMVTIIPVDHIEDVLKIALLPDNNEGFLDKLRKMATSKKIMDSSGIKPSAI
ncbi:MAG TPA: ATP-dependent protease LonB [Methanoregulaceae archaeon]|jgi:Lon-like ATP-dependent protease|nr:ATP-dependent protease LonB [Methanolinea sp.]MDD3090224.1 ATP-dependent protease LonB [Methanoregulaceae archaeon]MDD5685206.1 ATP-dependent protease LonB [Methanoregulaceae archaeon]HOP67124.1 ATP-dependent protease LonB [Methanoregulaceae archaeon]HPJ74213.1 ATP-dependent protease LonB [Methanoregulaceae archaeon]